MFTVQPVVNLCTVDVNQWPSKHFAFTGVLYQNVDNLCSIGILERSKIHFYSKADIYFK